MTAPTWESFRDDVQQQFLATVPEHQARLTWSAEQIAGAQRAGLQSLLTYAVLHSPFHRRRLAGVDFHAIDPTDLSRLPVMTKTDMMRGLDDVLTARRVDRAAVERALAATSVEPVPIHGEYIAMATGGSSGERGVFVYDRVALTAFLASLVRPMVARLSAAGGPRQAPFTIAMAAAASAVHATGLASAVTAGGRLPFRVVSVPATRPLPEIIARLNELQAPGLIGYPSLLVCLAAEQRAGRLCIAPITVTSTSETLTTEARRAVTDAFGVPVIDTFGSTEGLIGVSAPGDDAVVFNSDLCIVELVDEDYQPVRPGSASSRVLVTNLYNRTQPLIRYELSDSFVELAPARVSGHLRARVEGRADEVLHFDGVDVHPLVVRSVLVTVPQILDYQVHQMPRGIDVDVIAAGAVDVDAVRRRMVDALAAAGLPNATVRLRIVDCLERHHQTSKLRRFVPMATV